MGTNHTYFIGTPLFGSEKAAADRNQFFENVQEMDAVMIERWNRVVRPCDHVIVVGTLNVGNKEFARKLLDELNGSIRVCQAHPGGVKPSDHNSIIGVHDTYRFYNRDEDAAFPGVWVNYWPQVNWPSRVSGWLHVHGGFAGEVPDHFNPSQNRFNVSAQLLDFRPIGYGELAEYYKPFEGAKS